MNIFFSFKDTDNKSAVCQDNENMKRGQAMLFLSGIIFFLLAIVMRVYPPKKINAWYGYRTPLSTSSDQAWKLAQRHSPKAMFRYSLLMIFVGLFTGFYLLTDRFTPVILVIELIILLPLCTIGMILSTHRYLKRKL